MNPPLIIAELSANHNQDLDLALKHIQKAKEIGADCIKIQTYTPECLTLNSPKEHFKIKGGLWDGMFLYDLYSQAYTPFEWHKELFDYAKKLEITLFSSPFSLKALELLESLSCPMYKIASFELTDLELLRQVARTQKPLILSSGIATDEEIEEALEACKSQGAYDITLLKCTSAYPAKFEDANLLAMPEFAKKWGVKFGLSDHSEGFLLPVMATTLGASMIEKHFILDRSLGGADSAFSLNAKEFEEMIKQVHLASQALGDPHYQNSPQDPKRIFSRSIFIQKPIHKGERITLEHLTIKRPNIGLHPRDLHLILGKRVKRDLEFGDALRSEDLS
ncbi:pseudaminic acid synthase [Helicobacter pametensis]|uniref:pseudaminic acid synthase n=1 Tax=Helicobacter pametensis TaxID=95149 RepID=UPI000484A9D8|nr:pseudaminic acid synthase [Helicobacter pametensis]